VSPRDCATSSVTKDRIAARGMMARKLRVKTEAESQCLCPATRPNGTKTSKTFIHAVVGTGSAAVKRGYRSGGLTT